MVTAPPSFRYTPALDKPVMLPALVMEAGAPAANTPSSPPLNTEDAAELAMVPPACSSAPYLARPVIDPILVI